MFRKPNPTTLCAVLLFCGGLANAATFVVTTTVDENDGSALIGTGLSLRDAVMLSNESPGLDRIFLPSGFYELTIPEDGIFAGSGGALDIQGSVEFLPSDQALERPVISAGKRHRIFTVGNFQQSTIQLSITEIELVDGLEAFEGGAIRLGGNSELRMENSIVRNCGLNGLGITRGGAVFNEGGTSNVVEFIQCSFLNNQATEGSVLYSADSSPTFMNFNRFAMGNPDGSIPTFHFGLEPVEYDFNDNWYGNNAGPVEGIFTGVVAPSFWLIFTLEASRTSLEAAPAQIILSTSVNQTNDGGTSLTPLQNGIPLMWESQIPGPRVVEETLLSGVAKTTITALSSFGSYTEAVQLDEQELTVEFTGQIPNRGAGWIISGLN
jgi:hypothetical protein